MNFARSAPSSPAANPVVLSTCRRLVVLALSICVTITTVSLLPADDAMAQYFGRNKIQYENYDWKILNTPHFEIFFYPEEEDLAARAAVIAEDAYLRLSRIFGHELSKQIPFVLYASPNDFQQTNISDGLIGEGTGGFSEPMRNRMVLPYPGDNAGFVHVINHELVHVFMFDVVYHSTKAGGARRNWFPVPLWFAEGMAEWFASGWDQQADMWMRDATVHDWLIPLHQIYGGFQVYKEGQAAMRYIADTYGEQKVIELFMAMGRTRNVDRALEQTIGLDTRELSKAWEKSLKQTYWPLYSEKQEPDDIARRLTDHWEEQAYFFQQPSISPDGRWIAFFSDYDGLVDLFLMDAIEGTVVRKLVTGYRSNRFLTLHSFESSIGFSPDSKRISFVAKSGRDEHLYVVRIEDGKIEREIPLNMDIARSPAWSPKGDRVVLSGTRRGQTDLYLVELGTGSVTKLTDDIVDEHSPAWYPNGDAVLYSAYPATTADVSFDRDDRGVMQLQPVDFDRPNVKPAGTSYDLFRADTVTGETEIVLSTPGADEDPFVVDDDTIVFVSDQTGVVNLYVYKPSTGVSKRLTDVLGGIYHPSVSASSDRLVFTAFTRAGFDIFLLENFTELADEADFPQLPETRLAGTPVRSVTSVTLDLSGIADSEAVVSLADAVGETTAGVTEDRGAVMAHPAVADLPEHAVAAVAVAERQHQQTTSESVEQQESEPQQVEEEESVEEAEVPPASQEKLEPDFVDLTEVDEESASEAEARTIGTVEDYRLRFSLDPVGQGYGGVYYTEGVGLGLANVLSMSDLLGNHRMQFLINFYGSIKNSDLAASYYYLKRRVNLAGGIFHYRNFLNSNFTSLGEVYDRNQLFSERNYGVFGLASYPFTQFDRIDLEVQAFVSEKTFYEYDAAFGAYFRAGKQSDRLIQPSLSYVHDSSFYGQTGPITGSRWLVSFSPAVPLSDDDVDRVTTFVDYRRYFRMWDRNSFAVRFVGAQSTGGTPRNFVIGGPWTLRGWDTFAFEEIDENGDPRHPNLVGNKMLLMNLEYRFPFVDALILGWPGRWGIGGISGAVFFDAGTAFDDDLRFFSRTESGTRRLQDLLADFGFGIRANLGWLPLKFDWAWKTDFAKTADDVQFQFSIGPQF